jgi:dGTPase
MYRHWRVMRMQEKAKRLLSELFRAYIAEPSQLPFPVQDQIRKDGLECSVCDYVAGMTDRFALQEYAKMFDPNERI